jgi:immune inhibitor A
MKKGLVIAAYFFLLTGMALGVSLAPEIIQRLRESGQLANIVAADRQAREKGVWKPNANPYHHGLATEFDTLHCLIILVDFSDMPSTAGRNTHPQEFDTLLFSEGYRHPGSMTDYYIENSYGQILLVGQVTQWYRMPQTYAYYVNGDRGFGAYPYNAQKLAEDAVMAADPAVNFSLYDNNSDGVVDALFIVHAGPGYEDTGNLNYVHSHAWVVNQTLTLDNVEIHNYSMEPEETAQGSLINIGVYCHEFGHVLGVPDLYDYGYDSDGVGMWSVMAAGSWGAGGQRPVHFDGWSKLHLGWVSPTIPDSNIINVQIDAAEFSPDIYVLFSNGLSSSQYFVVENRQQVRFDVSLPGNGLLIYHVDEAVSSNDDQTHYHVAVEQADGRYDLENYRGSDSGDPWPGSFNRRIFSDSTIPNSNLYFNRRSFVKIFNISNSDSSMHADLSSYNIDPYFSMSSVTFNDSTGNGNGRPDTGETCQLLFYLQNSGANCDSLIVTAHCSDPSIIVSDSVSSFAMVSRGGDYTNAGDPMVFSVPLDYGSHFVDIGFDFSARDGQFHQEIIRHFIFGLPHLFLVDDDGGTSIDTFYTNALRNIGLAYVYWNESTMGSPLAQLSGFSHVIWFTGDNRDSVLPEPYVLGLTGYLAQGGRLLLTSQDAVQELSERNTDNDSIFLKEYLKVGYQSMSSSYIIDGEAGTVFNGMRFVTTGTGGANNQTSQDNLVTFSGGTTLLSYYTGDRPAAVGVQANYMAIIVGFGVEGINNGHPQSRTREDFLRVALGYLGLSTNIDDEPPAIPANIMLAQNYPNPFNAATTINYSLPLSGMVRLDIYDLLGRLVAIPIETYQAAGQHRVIWNASEVASGIYFYRLQVGQSVQTRRMLLLK